MFRPQSLPLRWLIATATVVALCIAWWLRNSDVVEAAPTVTVTDEAVVSPRPLQPNAQSSESVQRSPPPGPVAAMAAPEPSADDSMRSGSDNTLSDDALLASAAVSDSASNESWAASDDAGVRPGASEQRHRVAR